MQYHGLLNRIGVKMFDHAASSIARAEMALCAAVLLIACGGEHGASSADGETGLAGHELIAYDSIGVEMGDPNYVFGLPRTLEFTSNGNIVVGDMATMKMMMYSPDGVFLRSGGSEGEGPGEYLTPTGISPDTSGGILVADIMGAKLIFFDSLLNYDREWRGFEPGLPSNPSMLSSGSIIGILLDYDREESSVRVSNTLGRWEPGETEMSLTYVHRSAEVDLQNPRNSFYQTAIAFCVLQDGRVVASPVSIEEYIITCYLPDGEVDWEINPEYEKHRFCQEALDMQRELIRASLRRRGMDPSGADQVPMLEWTVAVSALYAQGERIWARRTEGMTPLFDIYSAEGEFLYSCSVPSLPYGNNIAFAISPYSSTVLAYPADPEDYCRIWMLREIDGSTNEQVW